MVILIWNGANMCVQVNIYLNSCKSGCQSVGLWVIGLVLLSLKERTVWKTSQMTEQRRQCSEHSSSSHTITIKSTGGCVCVLFWFCLIQQSISSYSRWGFLRMETSRDSSPCLSLQPYQSLVNITWPFILQYIPLLFMWKHYTSRPYHV